VRAFPDLENEQEVGRISVIADVAERKPRGAKRHACPGGRGALAGRESESKAPCNALGLLTLPIPALERTVPGDHVPEGVKVKRVETLDVGRGQEGHGRGAPTKD